jgi:putative transcriptional regulator
MKEMRNNVHELLARRARRLDRKRITVRQAAIETGISYYTLSALVNNTIREYPRDVLTKLCDYLDCNVGDILSYEEVPNG